MAKKANRKSKKGARKRPARPTGAGLTAYQHLLLDPCNGPVHSVYSGESGITQRFVSDFTVNSIATQTAGYICYCPAANQGVVWGASGSDASGSPTAFTGPGGPFLGANSNKSRAVAACVTVIPAAMSFNTLTGELATANIAYSTIKAANQYTTDGVFTLCNTRTVMGKRSYDTKWTPQVLDGTYSPTTTLGTTSLADPSDHSAILVAFRGLPAGIPLSIRITVVIEWTPQPALGLAVSSAPRPPVPYMTEAAVLHTRAPHWWNTFADDVGNHLLQQVGKGVKALASYGVQRGVRYAVSSFPMIGL